METDHPPSAPALAVLAFIQETGLPTDQIILGAVFLLILLLLSALFSGSEVALFTLESGQIEELELSETASSKRVVRLLRQPRAVLVSILILNTVVNVAAAITAAVLTHEIATANDWSPLATVLIEIVVLTFVILVVSEITPKLIATRQPVKFAQKISGFLLVLHRILFPLSSLLARSMQAFHGRFAGTADKISAEDLKKFLEDKMSSMEMPKRIEFRDTPLPKTMIGKLSRKDIIEEELMEKKAEELNKIEPS